MNTFESGLQGNPCHPIIIGLSTAAEDFLTVPADDLFASANYFKSEYPKVKRYINVAGNASKAAQAAIYTNSGLYDSECNRIITDSARDFDKATLADIVLTKSGSDPASLSFAARELAMAVLVSTPVDDAVSVIARNTLLSSAESADLVANATTRVLAEFAKKTRECSTLNAITGLSATEVSARLFSESSRAILKCHTGWGKSRDVIEPAMTTVLKDTALNSDRKHKRVLFISPLRSIVQALDVDGMLSYDDINPGDLDTARGLKIVVNSLISKKFAEYIKGVDLLVIDEVSQVIDHIFEGTVNNREMVWKALKEVVSSARHVVFADADINQQCVDLINANDAEPATLYVAEAAHTDIKVEVATIDEARNLAVRKAKLEPTLIACDVRKDATAIALELQKAGRKVLLVTSVTIEHADTRDFLANPNTDAWDVVVYSPSMKSSISITSGYFKNHFGLFEGSITPRGAVQMMRRDRTATSFVVGARNPRYRKSELARIEFEYSAKTPFERARFEHRRDACWLRDSIQFTLVLELRRQGFQVNVAKPNDALAKEGWKTHAKAKRALKEDTSNRLLTAKPLASIEMAEKVLREGSADIEEYFSAVRTEAEHHLRNKDLTLQDAIFWREGEGKAKLIHFKHMMKPRCPLTTLLAKIVKKMSTTNTWCPRRSAGAYRAICKYRDQAILLGFQMPRKDISARSMQGALTEILKAHGLKTKRRDGGKSYYYVIDPESMAQMKEYAGL